MTHGPRGHVERNAEIVAEHKAGICIAHLARVYGITPTRVREIIKRSERKFDKVFGHDLSARIRTYIVGNDIKSLDELREQHISGATAKAYNVGRVTLRELDELFGLPAQTERLAKMAKLTRNHLELIGRQKQTTAEMVRACVQRLKSPDSRKRAEAISGLEQLADLLEGKQQ